MEFVQDMPVGTAGVYSGTVISATKTPHGLGILLESLDTQPTVYVGQLRNGLKHGFGCFHDGGETSICMWKDDMRQGLTALYRKDGRLEKWRFELNILATQFIEDRAHPKAIPSDPAYDDCLLKTLLFSTLSYATQGGLTTLLLRQRSTNLLCTSSTRCCRH
jgi:hypothetical protein